MIYLPLVSYPSSFAYIKRGWLFPIVSLVGHHHTVQIRHLFETGEAVSNQQ